LEENEEKGFEGSISIHKKKGKEVEMNRILLVILYAVLLIRFTDGTTRKIDNVLIYAVEEWGSILRVVVKGSDENRPIKGSKDFYFPVKNILSYEEVG